MPIDSPAREIVGKAIRDLRLLVGLTQKALGEQVGQTQGWISRIERGRIEDITFGTAERLLGVLGARLVVAVDAPFFGDRRRQREPAHSRMSAHVARRLRREGWHVAVEVEVGGNRSRGWIDILAYHPGTRILLVIELKTEIVDIGAIQRSFSWYGREAWQAARRQGWRPERAVGCLLLLATEANDDRARANRDVLDLEFPGRAAGLTQLVRGRASRCHPQPLRSHGRSGVAASHMAAAASRGWPSRRCSVPRLRRFHALHAAGEGGSLTGTFR